MPIKFLKFLSKEASGWACCVTLPAFPSPVQPKIYINFTFLFFLPFTAMFPVFAPDCSDIAPNASLINCMSITSSVFLSNTQEQGSSHIALLSRPSMNQPTLNVTFLMLFCPRRGRSPPVHPQIGFDASWRDLVIGITTGVLHYQINSSS